MREFDTLFPYRTYRLGLKYLTEYNQSRIGMSRKTGYYNGEPVSVKQMRGDREGITRHLKAAISI